MANRKKVNVPDWAQDAIWYQIFPERFRNGCARSNPKLDDFSKDPVPGWRVMPWGMDWYALDRWEQPVSDFWKTVFMRRYGGDLVGVRKKLGYLQDLGINAIYLNPVFKAPSLHKYDASCMHHIDPTLGPDRAGDLKKLTEWKETEDPASWRWTSADLYFLEFLEDAHARGIRVIIDGVFNHTGRNFFAFRKLLREGRRSRYADWYKIKQWNKDGTFEYDGWFGHKMLPEFARTKNDLVAPVRDYVFNITRRWLDPDEDGNPADGIDGWRLDVAFCVPLGFWRKWRTLVKSINPNAYTTAEIVGRADEYLRGDTFDAVMNYMWLYPTVNFFAPQSNGFSARTVRQRLNELRRAYAPETLPVLQNLLDSHDVGRIASMLENVKEPIKEFGAYFEYSRVKHRTSFKTGRPGVAAFQALRQAIVYQMCSQGAPMLYYGTEVGMWGANDPCDRQPMLWDDVRYDDERHNAQGALAPRRTRKPDAKLRAFVKKAIAMRHEHPALRRGSLHWIRTGNDRLLAFERRLDGTRIRAYFNASDHDITVPLKQTARDLWVGGAAGFAGGVCIEKRSWKILLLGR